MPCRLIGKTSGFDPEDSGSSPDEAFRFDNKQEQTNMYKYNAKIEQIEDCYLVTFPDFGWGCTDGQTIKEAVEEAVDCLDSLIAATIRDDDKKLPEAKYDSKYSISPSLTIASKLSIYQEFQRQKKSK